MTGNELVINHIYDINRHLIIEMVVTCLKRPIDYEELRLQLQAWWLFRSLTPPCVGRVEKSMGRLADGVGSEGEKICLVTV